MGKSDAERFVVEANQNPEIQNDLLQRVEAPAMVEVGKKHGFNFTADEVKATVSGTEGESAAAAPHRITNVRTNGNQNFSGGPAPGGGAAA